MRSFVVSKDAHRDLDEIHFYLAEHAGPETADRIIDAIMDRFLLLGEYPGAGRNANELAEGVRCFPAGKYLIYYRRKGKVTQILHILHGAREQIRAFGRAKRLS